MSVIRIVIDFSMIASFPQLPRKVASPKSGNDLRTIVRRQPLEVKSTWEFESFSNAKSGQKKM